MSKITDTVYSLAQPQAEALGLEIWDIEYVREAGDWYLRIYIDKDGGVSIDDCEALSRAMDPVLDEQDPIPSAYTFEVSSAGAERELKRPSDFERYMGSCVEVKHYTPVAGSKSHIGTLVGYSLGNITLETKSGVAQFDKSQVAQVRLHIDF